MGLVAIAKKTVVILRSFLQTYEKTRLACLLGIIPVGHIYLFPEKQTCPVGGKLGTWEELFRRYPKD